MSGTAGGGCSVVRRAWLTLADANDLWLDDEDYIWFYNSEDQTWQTITPNIFGGWGYNDDGEPNPDIGPFTLLKSTYRDNELEPK